MRIPSKKGFADHFPNIKHCNITLQHNILKNICEGKRARFLCEHMCGIMGEIIKKIRLKPYPHDCFSLKAQIHAKAEMYSIKKRVWRRKRKQETNWFDLHGKFRR